MKKLCSQLREVKDEIREMERAGIPFSTIVRTPEFFEKEILILRISREYKKKMKKKARVGKKKMVKRVKINEDLNDYY